MAVRVKHVKKSVHVCICAACLSEAHRDVFGSLGAPTLAAAGEQETSGLSGGGGDGSTTPPISGRPAPPPERLHSYTLQSAVYERVVSRSFLFLLGIVGGGYYGLLFL